MNGKWHTVFFSLEENELKGIHTTVHNDKIRRTGQDV